MTAEPGRVVKWGASVGITDEDLAALAHDQFRYRETVADLIARSATFRGPDPIVISPAMAAQLGVRGFGDTAGRPAPHDPNPRLVSLLLNDRKDRP